MAGTVSDEDHVGCLKLYVSKERMRMTDFDNWRENIAITDHEQASEKALEDGQLNQPFKLANKCVLVFYLALYRMISIWYHIFYFYFAPFLVSIIMIYSNQLQNI